MKSGPSLDPIFAESSPDATELTQLRVRAEFQINDPKPESLRSWVTAQWRHREVLWILARTTFNVRYKRASFGVLWAVAVPAVQAAALAFVFSHFVRTTAGYSYSAYAVSGVLAWGYVSQVLPLAGTAIVDANTLTDKLWFPRSLLVLVHCLANLPGFLISMGLMVIALPLLGAHIGLHTLLLLPAILVLLAFCTALSLLLAALHVYFRDVRYLLQASLLVLFYLTPAVYPQRSVGAFGPWMAVNPFTGVMSLFHLAVVGSGDLWSPNLSLSILITLVSTVLLWALAIEVHRRRDRLFVDLL